MVLTTAQLNRATLARQLLLRREPIPVPEAVHRVVALQAQEPAGPYVALWNRVAGFDPADLDAAFDSRAIVKATLMRVTLHAVEAGDHPAFHDAMQVTLRAARLNDRRFRRTGLTPDDADALVPDLLAFAARPRVRGRARGLGGLAGGRAAQARRLVGPAAGRPPRARADRRDVDVRRAARRSSPHPVAASRAITVRRCSS